MAKLEEQIAELKAEKEALQKQVEELTEADPSKRLMALAEKLYVPTAARADSTFEVGENAAYPAQVAAHKSLHDAAGKIVTFLRAIDGKSNSFLLADADLIDNLITFEVTIRHVDSLSTHIQSVLKSMPGTTIKLEALSPLIALATLTPKVFDIAAKIGSYFEPTVKMSGYKVSVSMNTLVAMMVDAWGAGSGDGLIDPATNVVSEIISPGKSPFLEKLHNLWRLRDEAITKAASIADEQKKPLEALVQIVNGLESKLFESTKGAIRSNLANLLIAEKVSKVLEDSKNFLLLLEISAVGGGSVSIDRLWAKKKLFYHGGVIVTATVLDNKGKIKSAKTFIEEVKFASLPIPE